MGLLPGPPAGAGGGPPATPGPRPPPPPAPAPAARPPPRGVRASRRGRGLGPRASAWLALGVGLAWAFLDEWHQSALLARTGSALDVLLDATGAVAALGGGGLGGRAARGG